MTPCKLKGCISRTTCAWLIYANRKTGGGGKGNFFPLANDSLYTSEDATNNEEPLLLDPCVAEDVALLSFLGNNIVAVTEDSNEKQRVKVSEIIYNLNDPYIKSERGKVWGSVEKALEEYASGDRSRNSCIRQLRDAVSREAPFSACAIACVNSLAPDEIKNELDLSL